MITAMLRPTSPLSLHRHLSERSSPSRVRSAAQNRRALDRSGPFRTPTLEKGKGQLQSQNHSQLAALCRLPLVGPNQKSALPP
jgi:hypothetical protein